MSRENKMMASTGRKRIGKSTTILKELLWYAFKSRNPQKSLIADTNDEYGSFEIDGVKHSIPLISPSEIPKYSHFKGGAVKRINFKDNKGFLLSKEETEKRLIIALNYFRKGILFIDDLNNIFGKSLPQNFEKVLGNNAHRQCDILFNLQSLDRMLPVYWDNVNIVRYFYQLNEVSSSAGKIDGGELELFLIVEKLVNTQYLSGDIRFYVEVDRDDKKIKGKFSPKMLSNSIQEYLSENPSKMKALIQRRDGHGKQINKYEDALLIKTRELFAKYWGN